MKDVNNLIAGIKPRATPKTSVIRPPTNRIATRTIPTSARKAVFFSVMVKVWTLCAISTRANGQKLSGHNRQSRIFSFARFFISTSETRRKMT